MRHLAARPLFMTLVLLLSCCASPGTAARRQSSEEPLTNASVIKLVRAGFADKTVISIIGSHPVRFELSADRLVELKRRGVSEKVILAMIARANGGALAAADWGDDAFFGDAPPGGSDRPGRGSPQGGGEPGEVNIFGSSGGAKGRTRTRGGGASGENDTQTTGSASVRILRPPAEAGGAPTLERTPTLTNESIVQLAEAGFSEGTIVRRIEQSPADFDLSQKKLEELRRRGVSDRVIEAMRAAMSEETPPVGGRPDGRL